MKNRSIVEYHNGKPQGVWASIATLGNEGYDPSTISKVARGERKSHGGSEFRYLAETKQRRLEKTIGKNFGFLSLKQLAKVGVKI
jgi:hypothetical protein